jgi:hypothetical protein
VNVSERGPAFHEPAAGPVDVPRPNPHNHRHDGATGERLVLALGLEEPEASAHLSTSKHTDSMEAPGNDPGLRV